MNKKYWKEELEEMCEIINNYTGIGAEIHLGVFIQKILDSQKEKIIRKIESNYWHVDNKIGGISRGCNCEIEEDCINNLISKIKLIK